MSSEVSKPIFMSGRLKKQSKVYSHEEINALRLHRLDQLREAMGLRDGSVELKVPPQQQRVVKYVLPRCFKCKATVKHKRGCPSKFLLKPRRVEKWEDVPLPER